MPANSTHPDYDAAWPEWIPPRVVLDGEAAVKAAGVRQLLRLDSQGGGEYAT